MNNNFNNGTNEIGGFPINDINKQLEAEARLQQEINRLESIVKQKLTKEALLRFGNVKAAHPELALNLVIILANLIQQGRIQGQITDDQLKEFLKQLSQKRDFRIRRK